MLRIMIKMGFHGKAHQRAIDKAIQYMHDNGIGA